MMNLDLKDVHVLITGASGGIGLETTKVFLQQGAKVTAHYNTNRNTLDTLASEVDRSADALQIAPCDLSSETSVREFFSKISGGAFGPVQVAIINHAIYPIQDAPLKDMSLAQWDRTISTNLTSSFLVAREYLRYLENATDKQKKKASILFIGSTAGKFGEANHADYCATKSAMMYGMTKSLKNEIVKIAPLGRVNCVAPGWVRTPMAEEALKNPKIIYRAIATTPLKKVANPYDVAGQIVVLSSPKISGHVSGEVIMVHGGMEGRLLNEQSEI